MNKYKITYSLFPIENNKITSKNHFSNCRSTIEGNTFDEAVEKFKEQKLKEGYAVGFLIEGDLVKIEIFDL